MSAARVRQACAVRTLPLTRKIEFASMYSLRGPLQEVTHLPDASMRKQALRNPTACFAPASYTALYSFNEGYAGDC